MRKRSAIPLIAGGTLVAIGAVAWLNRTSIATDFVDSALVERGVLASYTIDQIGVREQRLRNVVIGDPADPDLIAREIDVTLGVGWSGPYVTAVRARGVRLNGRWTGDALTLGQIDRLLPEPDGSPFALPDIRLDLADATARIDTPWGRTGFDIAGQGNLTGGFVGEVAFSAPRLAFGDCRATRTSGLTEVSVVDGAPAVRGPLGIAALRCARAALALNDLKIGIAANTDREFATIRSRTGVRGGNGSIAGVALEGLTGSLGINGAVQGELEADWALSASKMMQTWVAARQVSISGRGRRLASGAVAANGRVALSGGRISGKTGETLSGLTAIDDSTPVGPLARKLGSALKAAGSDFAFAGDFVLAGRTVDALTAASDSIRLMGRNGARLSLVGDRSISWNARSGLAVAGTLEMGGGGLPEGGVRLNRAGNGSVEGEARFAPYAAGTAVVALAPVAFRAAPDGRTRFSTGVAVSGPLAGGYVDRLSLPVSGDVTADGTMRIDGGCRALRWQSLAVSGTMLDPGRIQLCGRGAGPLLAVSQRGLSGGATVQGFGLSGRTGSSAVRFASGGGSVDLADFGFVLRDVDASIGDGDSATRFVAAALSGSSTAGGYAGELREGRGKIGPTPFLLSGANGRWRFGDGGLHLDTTLLVDDAAEEDRFQRLASDAIAVTYRDGVVRADGRLSESVTGTAVADLAIEHRFDSGNGTARFAVPGIAFVRDGVQPVDISRLALGVVANVEGRVGGSGLVRWTPDGIDSSGSFSTERLDLAAAFGPVERLSGTIRFDDLIGLTTRPGQEVLLGSVNPGIEVLDGRVQYQLLPDRQVRIERGLWPFSGGQLLLQPTLLDFSADRPRRLTFDVSNVDAALFLQRYEFDNITATGIFDGVMPTIFDADGGRVVGGSLVSRDGGGTLAYVGELSNRDLGVMANLAYGALKSLRYDNLVIRLNGRIDGEMLTEVDFSGLAQGADAERNIFTRAIARLPFIFRIRINAPFRQLLTSARGLYDPTDFIDQNLPALLRAERDAAEAAEAARRAAAGEPPVQASESEDQR